MICHPLGVDSFLMYSIHEGVRGIALDPNDNSEALMPITGTLFAVGVDFHAGMIPCSTQGIFIVQSGFNREYIAAGTICQISTEAWRVVLSDIHFTLGQFEYCMLFLVFFSRNKKLLLLPQAWWLLLCHSFASKSKQILCGWNSYF